MGQLPIKTSVKPVETRSQALLHSSHLSVGGVSSFAVEEPKWLKER